MLAHLFSPVMQVLLNLELKTQELLKVSKYVARLVQFLSTVSIIYFSLLKECTQDAFFTSSKITKCNLMENRYTFEKFVTVPKNGGEIIFVSFTY